MATQLSQVTQWLDNSKESVNRALRDPAKPWTKGFDLVEQRTGVDRIKIFTGEFRLQQNSTSFTVGQDYTLTHPRRLHNTWLRIMTKWNFQHL